MSNAEQAPVACVVERTLNAPIAQVWQMWADPEHFKQWYGPQGFTIPVAQIDFTVGGKRLVGMESPDGQMKMFSTGEHTEIAEPTRLVYTESPSDADGNAMDPADMGMPGMPAVTIVTVELESMGDQTKMTLTHSGVPEQAAGGWGQAFDKLDTYLAR